LCFTIGISVCLQKKEVKPSEEKGKGREETFVRLVAKNGKGGKKRGCERVRGRRKKKKDFQTPF